MKTTISTPPPEAPNTVAPLEEKAGFQLTRWLPLIIALLGAVWYGTHVRVPADKDWAFSEFGRIPIVVKGRHMPMDTFARSALTLIRKREEANFEPWKKVTDHPRIVSATEWAVEVMTNPEVADTRPVFRMDNPDLKGLLGLPMDPSEEKKTDGKHYSWNDLQPRWKEFEVEVMRAGAKNSKVQSAYEQAVVGLWNSTQYYRRLKLTFGPAAKGDLAAGLADFNQHIERWRTAVDASRDGQDSDPEIMKWDAETRMEAPLIAPRKGGAKIDEAVWASAYEEVLAINRGEPAPTLGAYAQIAAAFRSGDHAGFAAAVRSHLSTIQSRGGFEPDLKKASREQLFNFAAPFYYGMYLAVIAGLLAVAYWFDPARMEWARRSAVYLLLLTLLIETAGHITRVLIEGRPPVTNLYTSAIFIGWGATILGLLLERAFPFAIGAVVAACIQFVSLWIGQFLAERDGTTFTVLEAVLNTNFWLATHVVIVTLGYASTFIAGFLAIVYVLFGTFTNRLDKPLGELTARRGALPAREGGRPLGKVLATMVYAIACFATLFSFVGTVLGGLWADQSWGRFWGWDVKENGALMIVLWNAILLHARWGGLVRERGLMCLAIFGNVVTAWSWFGVNTLAVGLHSYGFTQGEQIALVGFAISQVALIVLAWLRCAPGVGKTPVVAAA
jgi:ABC-type transport system involved in cytochrome c biogenesis permease subunit